MGFNSKYTGQETENLLDIVKRGIAYPLREPDGSYIKPNHFYDFGEVENLQVSFDSEEEYVMNEYIFQFKSGDTPTTLSVPSNIIWANGIKPIPKSNATYQISVVNNLGTFLEFTE